MEEWRTVTDFPDYEISNLWKVRNKKTKVELTITFRGVGASVTLMREGVQYTRSLPKLMRMAFGGKK